MKIVSWNVNGIRALHRKGLFMSFIVKHKPDIVCLQETKAEQHQSEVDLPDYEEYWNSAKRKGYSGTAIFTKEKPLSVSFNIPEKIAKKYNLIHDGYGDPNTEGRLTVAEYKKFYVVTIYTPNAKEDLSRISLRHKQWDPAFLEYMVELENPSTGSGRGKPVIFCGDLNVAHTEDDLANPKQNKGPAFAKAPARRGKHGFTDEEREGIQNMVELGFIDSFRIFTKGNGHYTWWSHFSNARARNVGWRIDYIFVSSSLKNKVKRAVIYQEVLGSDHCPIEVEIVL